MILQWPADFHLVQYEDLSPPQQRSCHAQQLTLSCAQVRPPLSNVSVKPSLQGTAIPHLRLPANSDGLHGKDL